MQKTTSRTLSNSRLLLALFFFHLAACAFVARADSYVEIEADISVYGVTNSANDYRFSVVCVTGTNEWRIDPSFRESGKNQWFFDGTNVYNNIIAIGRARQLGGRVASRTNEVGSKTNATNATNAIRAAVTNSSVHVRMSPGGFPMGDVTANIPWLAFCSGTYLKRAGRVVPQPLVTSFRHMPDGFGYSDKTVTFEDELGLPKTIDLFASEAHFRDGLKSGFFAGNQDPEVWKRGSMGFKWDYPDGAHRLHYKVTESTNFLGWNIPLKFELVLNEQENGMMVPRSGARGTVTSIRSVGHPDSLIAGQNVVDWRLKNDAKGVKGMIYRTTNALVSATNDPALQASFAKWVKKKSAKSPATKRAQARTIMIGILVLAALAPLAMLLYQRQQKQRNSSNQSNV